MSHVDDEGHVYVQLRNDSYTRLNSLLDGLWQNIQSGGVTMKQFLLNRDVARDTLFLFDTLTIESNEETEFLLKVLKVSISQFCFLHTVIILLVFLA